MSHELNGKAAAADLDEAKHRLAGGTFCEKLRAIQEDHRRRAETLPSTNGGNGSPPTAPGDGRDPRTGRFLKGWKGGPGNPHLKKLARIRRAF